ncbi:MAG: PEP-CTERM sorting domain-containing protein [Planctomycetota bacterium]|nr:PEP-CTERM sorting domain-containing protein [Planctomycetota bacterium]
MQLQLGLKFVEVPNPPPRSWAAWEAWISSFARSPGWLQRLVDKQPKYSIPKTIFNCTFLILDAHLFGGNAHAGVVGISPTTSVTGNAASVYNNPLMTFKTSSTGNLQRLSGIGFYGIASQTLGYSGVTVTVDNAGGGFSKTGTLNINANANGEENTISWQSGFDGYLQQSATISVRFNSGIIDLTKFYSMGNVLYQVDAGVSSYWNTPAKKATTSTAFVLYYGATAVPEPATLILTGSALAAGAFGAWLKRRKRASTVTVVS